MFLHQPIYNKKYTPIPITEIKIIREKFEKNNTPQNDKILQKNNLINKQKKEKKKYKFKFNLLNLISSLENNLTASLKGWKIPQKKTLTGPKRIWIYLRILRSKRVKKATATIIKIKLTKYFKTKFKIIGLYTSLET